MVDPYIQLLSHDEAKESKFNQPTKKTKNKTTLKVPSALEKTRIFLNPQKIRNRNNRIFRPIKLPLKKYI